MTPEDLARSDAFQAGLFFLETGYFWEAHEVLEPVWMALPEGSDQRHLVQALIQFANAQLKFVMQRAKAAKRLCEIVRGLLMQIEAPQVMGLDIAVFAARLDSFEESIGSVL